MTSDEIIELAKRADPAGEDGRLYSIAALTPETLARFASLVAAVEREACAKVCEQIANELSNWPSSFEGANAETKWIRAMGETIAKPFVEAMRARGNS